MAGGIMLAVLSFSFTHMTDNGAVIASAQREQIATTLEDNAEVMSNTQLAALLAPRAQGRRWRDPSVQPGIARPIAAGALLVPLLASLGEFVNGFRMRRLPDIEPVANREGPDFRLIGVRN
jgi:hypothetical protein